MSKSDNIDILDPPAYIVGTPPRRGISLRFEALLIPLRGGVTGGTPDGVVCLDFCSSLKDNKYSISDFI